METEFYSLTEKRHIMDMLESGDKKAVKIVINEIQRLEGVIKDYEIAFGICASKIDCHTFKKPTPINNYG